MNNNKFLIVVDGSYFMYYTLFGSVYDFERKHPDEASHWIKPADETDQQNLPNIINSSIYKKILKKFVMKRLESVDMIVKQNFQNDLDFADRVDIVFAQDDRVKYSFRTQLYPEYKAQRAVAKKQFQIQPIKDYIVDVIFKELNVSEKYGYHLIKVEGAEGDDVIATTLTQFKDKYVNRCLIASDHDFLQLDGVKQFDLFGKEVKRDLGGEEVSPAQYLLGKILMGDKSDNIKQVFAKCGPKTALKLVKNEDVLKKMLDESQESSTRYLLNKKIISFSEIPKELTSRIVEKVNQELYQDEVLNEQTIDLKQFMMM